MRGRLRGQREQQLPAAGGLRGRDDAQRVPGRGALLRASVGPLRRRQRLPEHASARRQLRAARREQIGLERL